MTSMITNDNEKTPKNAEQFTCSLCNFNCSKNSEWMRHIATRKHQKIMNDNEKMPENASSQFICECGKTYKYSSGLSRHKNAKNSSGTSEKND
jgi:hypothetical protein